MHAALDPLSTATKDFCSYVEYTGRQYVQHVRQPQQKVQNIYTRTGIGGKNPTQSTKHPQRGVSKNQIANYLKNQNTNAVERT